MSISDYEKWTDSTAIYPRENVFEALNYVVLGFVGEAGEVANKFKKTIRDNHGIISDETIASLKDEVGDTIWYLARICKELGTNIEDIAELNKNKLENRMARGKISGSGDNR